MNLTAVQCYICNVKFVEEIQIKQQQQTTSSKRSHHKNKDKSQNNSTNYNGVWQVFCQYFYGVGGQRSWENNRLSLSAVSFCPACKILLDKLNVLQEQLECIQKNITTVVNTISSTIIQQSSVSNNANSNNSHHSTKGGLNLHNSQSSSHNNYICNTPQFPNHQSLNNNAHNNFTEHHSSNGNLNQSLGHRAPEYSTQPAFPGAPWPNSWTLGGGAAAIGIPASGLQSQSQGQSSGHQGQPGGVMNWGWKPGSVLTSMSSNNDAASPYFESQDLTLTSSTTKGQRSQKQRSKGHHQSQGQGQSQSQGGEEGPILLHANKYPYQKIGDEYKCGTCGTRKSTRQLLVTHLNYHRLLDSKQWSCSICGKSFSRQREVSRHERTHFSSTLNLPLSKITPLSPDQGSSSSINDGHHHHHHPMITEAPHHPSTSANGQSFLYEGVWPFEQLPNGIGFRCSSCGCLKEKKSGIMSHLRWVHHQKQKVGSSLS